MSRNAESDRNDDDDDDDDDEILDGKRTKMTDTLITNPTDEELAGMSRSERKRFREKKRRSEVNKGFDDLIRLLQEIDPSIGSNRKQNKVETESALNRVDLINVTVSVLERVHRENERNKRIISERDLRPQNEEGREGQGLRDSRDKKVMMVLPYLTPVIDDQPFPTRFPSHPDHSGREGGQYYREYGHYPPPQRESQRHQGFY